MVRRITPGSTPLISAHQELWRLALVVAVSLGSCIPATATHPTGGHDSTPVSYVSLKVPEDQVRSYEGQRTSRPSPAGYGISEDFQVQHSASNIFSTRSNASRSFPRELIASQGLPSKSGAPRVTRHDGLLRISDTVGISGEFLEGNEDNRSFILASGPAYSGNITAGVIREGRSDRLADESGRTFSQTVDTSYSAESPAVDGSSNGIVIDGDNSSLPGVSGGIANDSSAVGQRSSGFPSEGQSDSLGAPGSPGLINRGQGGSGEGHGPPVLIPGGRGASSEVTQSTNSNNGIRVASAGSFPGITSRNHSASIGSVGAPTSTTGGHKDSVLGHGSRGFTSGGHGDSTGGRGSPAFTLISGGHRVSTQGHGSLRLASGSPGFTLISGGHRLSGGRYGSRGFTSGDDGDLGGYNRWPSLPHSGDGCLLCRRDMTSISGGGSVRPPEGSHHYNGPAAGDIYSLGSPAMQGIPGSVGEEKTHESSGLHGYLDFTRGHGILGSTDKHVLRGFSGHRYIYSYGK
ncbi:uncharacterized protein [Panulirus ornatus]|uniref:uncharacterized protein n=1 Tax=Panulirus ornatus TaxID=150431 RepID=UPI003A8C037C